MAKRCLNRHVRKRSENKSVTIIRRILKVSLGHGASMRMKKKLHGPMNSKRLNWMRFWRNGTGAIAYPKTNHSKRNPFYTVSYRRKSEKNQFFVQRLFVFIFLSLSRPTVKDPLDYQGRSFLHAPHDVGVNLRSHAHPDKCFLPKSHIHTWTGHTKGIAAIRLLPKTAHLLLSGSMDCRVKLWEVYKERRCIRTYFGHRQAVKDVGFNNDGTQFLSAAYDRYIKLWDTETGDVVQRFTSKKIPFCVKFHPDQSKQHLFVAGTSDKKIICVSLIDLICDYRASISKNHLFTKIV